MDNELVKRVKKLQSDIKDLKTNQAVGGDSWLVYRTEIIFTLEAYKSYKVNYSPNSTGRFVAKAFWTTPDRSIYGTDQYLMPDPNYDGLWYYVPDQRGGPQPRTIFIYSTKKGTITITDLTAAITV